MATVNLGRIKFVWQGAYNGATAYVADDVVSYNGSSYICILASTGNLPTNTTYWNLMAQTGTDITSIAGLAQGDVLYYNGTSWVRLGAGTSGQFLKTNGSGANPSWSTLSDGFGSQLFHAVSTTFTMTSGSFLTTSINTVLTNEITGATLSSNIISLPAGTYYTHSMVNFYRTNGSVARLYNSTDSTVLVNGLNVHSWEDPQDATSPVSNVIGRFTLSGTKNVVLQYFVARGNNQVGGVSSPDYNNAVQIWKIA